MPRTRDSALPLFSHRKLRAWLMLTAGALCLSPTAPWAASDFGAYEGWVIAAGEAHRHGGTAYSLVALEGAVTGRGPCPHEFGHPVAIYEKSREKGLDWLSLSFHVGVGRIIKPDKTPHRLSGSASDPAYRWWTRPGRGEVPSGPDEYVLRPSPDGFPDYVSGGTVTPPFNEALSLSSAANAANRDGEFVAFTGREFTTEVLGPSGAEAGQGGHKTILFPGDTISSCGSSTDPTADVNCRSERDLYQWAVDGGAIIIQAHPGHSPRLPRFSKKRALGGFSDRYVQGIEVGRANRFEPAWEVGYQEALRLGYRLFPAYGSDLHSLGGVGECKRGGPDFAAQGVSICWTEKLTRVDLVESMRQRRCYYSRSNKPELRFEAAPTGADAPTAMGSLVTHEGTKARVRVSAVNDLRNQMANKTQHRFHRLELVRVSRGGAKVVATCELDGDPDCRCIRGDATRPDRCEFEGQVDIDQGALYPRILAPKGEMRCMNSPASDCVGHPAVLVGAPLFFNWND